MKKKRGKAIQPAPVDGRVTRVAVAAAAGVSGFTVSQVMAGRAGVAPATRERVLAVAQAMGYRPDPAAARLVGHRHRTKRAAARPVVALLHSDHLVVHVIQGLLAPLAEEFGLDVRLRRVTEDDDPAVVLRALWQEGTTGILMIPGATLATPEWREADWSRFSVVKANRGLPQLAFHQIRHSAWDYMLSALNQVIARGYRRLAVQTHRSLNPSDDLARLGALLAVQQQLFPAGTVCDHREVNAKPDGPWFGPEDVAWLRDFQPDVLVAYHRVVIYDLRDAGLLPPKPFAMAAVVSSKKLHGGVPVVAGNDAHESELYARGLRILREMILNGERGMTAHPMEHVVTPDWVEGETLPWVDGGGQVD